MSLLLLISGAGETLISYAAPPMPVSHNLYQSGPDAPTPQNLYQPGPEAPVSRPRLVPSPPVVG